MSNLLDCKYFAQDLCHSCQWLSKPYLNQLDQKSDHLKRLVSPFILQKTEWFPAIVSELKHFRNKAKMVVTGSVERPILGILTNGASQAVDLTDCSLYPKLFYQLFPILKDFIARAGLVPYNITKKRGELKYILLTYSTYNHAVMVRFVLRSELKLSLIEREFPALQAKLPAKSVVSLNIQPEHSAILEGEKEIFLSKNHTLEEHFNNIPLFIRPQGFFQTNPKVASQLYATAANWIKDLPISSLWDLFCGVGGFGLHCLNQLQSKNPDAQLTGIEISASAIASATKSAHQLGLNNVSFASLDSAQFALSQQIQTPDLVIVNPPRRGMGKELAEFLNQLGPPYLIYSSCNAETMVKDFESLQNYELVKIQLFDMFPHTAHYEVLNLFTRK